MNIRYFDKRGEVWLDFKDHSGKRRRVPSGFPTQADAERNAPAIIAALYAKDKDTTSTPKVPPQATAPALQGLSFEEAFKKGMNEREKWLKSKDQSSLTATYGQVVEYWGKDTKLASATREAVLKWRSEMVKAPGKSKGTTLTASTINHRLSMLSVLLEIANLPPHTVKHLSTKGNARQRRITNREVEAMKDWLLAHAERVGAVSMANLITMALETGARLSELLELQWVDVAADTLTFRQTKNSTSRTIPLTAAAKRVLKARKGQPKGPFSDLDVDRTTALWGMARKGLGLAEDKFFVFHGLRHECLSRLADKNKNAMVIQAIAGHESIATTQRYVHASLGAMRSAMGLSR